MSATPVIHGGGTPEWRWRSWSRVFPPLELAGCRRLVVVAPHPDDEVLGVGGLMATAVGTGVELDIVAVTDGDASHPGSPTVTPAELARLRPAESACALLALGLSAATTRLRVPDGRVRRHEPQVTEVLRSLLAGDPTGTWCLATARFDGHPDHEATGRAAAAACTATGARLLEYPVWAWHWAKPDDPTVPWERASTIVLRVELEQAKKAAAQCFGTQIRPLSDDPADAAVLPPPMLERLLRSWELVFS